MFDMLKTQKVVVQENTERALRPSTLEDYIGQEELKQKLKIAIEAAKERTEALDHILLTGPPGLGKSSFASVIAKECDSRCYLIHAPAVKSEADLLEVLMKVQPRDVVFLDECQSLSAKVQENIYNAMEDYKVSMKMGNKQLQEMPVNPFCLIGATTHPGKMTQPFRDRFGIHYSMQFYDVDELATIVKVNSKKLEVGLDPEDETSLNIAKRSRGTPRVANRLLRRCRDYAQLNNNNIITNNMVDETMSLEGIDENGFTQLDRTYIEKLFSVYKCGPCGIQPIDASCGEDTTTISEFIEPFLIRQEIIARTQRGRVLTPKGADYIRNNI